ncbi:MAG TPA: hypothetical protein VFD58_12240 [Blastocatellia bacterium]|nr:hypothetical protein [Blastocatellia bacterium]
MTLFEADVIFRAADQEYSRIIMLMVNSKKFSWALAVICVCLSAFAENSCKAAVVSKGTGSEIQSSYVKTQRSPNYNIVWDRDADVSKLRKEIIQAAFTADNGKTDDSPARTSLTLTTALVSERFCFGDGEVATMQIKLRLQYKNTGRRPVILYKGSNIVTSIRVSKTAGEALAGRHELSLSPAVLVSGERPIKQELDDLFIVLRPGEAFNTETDVAIPFTTETGRKIFPGTVATGNHVIQIKVVTWPELPELAKEMGTRWSRSGYLWHDTIEAAPMQFAIEPEPKLQECP